MEEQSRDVRASASSFFDRLACTLFDQWQRWNWEVQDFLTGGHVISWVAKNHLIKSGGCLDLRRQEKRRLEHEGPPRPAPNSAFIHRMTHILKEIHVGFSPIFIHCISTIFPSARTIDLHQIANIWWPSCFRPMDCGIALLESCDHCRGVPPP